MMKKRRIILCLTLLAAFTCAGCSGKKEETAPASEETAAEAEEPEEKIPEFTEEDEAKLYNLYIDINNSMVGRYNDVLERYFEYVDFQEEFTLFKDYYSGISMISTFYDAMDEADELAARKPEKSELDEIYIELSPVMRKLAETLDEVAEYTEEDSFEQDDFARGRELHAVIWENYSEYERLGTEFLNALGAEASGKREEDMEQMQQEGYEATYAIMKMIDTAQQIQTAVYEQGIDDSNMLELDVDALQPLYDQFMEERQTVLEHMADTDAMYEEGYPVNSAYYATFEDGVEKAGEELEEIFKNVREQKAPGSIQIESSFIVSGTIGGFDAKISAMIDDYNTMLSY